MSQAGRLERNGGSGGVSVNAIQVDASTPPGTNPVVPNGVNLLTITGGQVAAGVVGTNVIRTDSKAANTFTIEVQRSQAVGVSTLADNGVSHFNSANFSVDANGFVSLAGSGIYISLTPYIVGPDIHSGFATLQAAITQAAADGASATNQKNIYVKPQIGGYTENPVISDGINIIGFGSSVMGGVNVVNSLQPSVVLNGSITVAASATVSVTGFSVTVTGATDLCTLGNNATITFKDSFLTASTGSLFPQSTVGRVNLLNCIAEAISGSLYTTIGVSFPTFNFEDSLVFAGSTTASAGSNLAIGGLNSYLGTTIDASSANALNVSFYQSVLSTLGGAFVFKYGAATSGQTGFINCLLTQGSSSFITGSNSNTTFVNNVYNSTFTNTAPPFVTAPLVVIGNSLNSNTSRQIFKLNIVGFQGSESQSGQAALQTTSGAAQTLISIPVAAGTSITLQGQITAANAGHTDMTGGNFLVMADGTAAALVGVPVINSMATSTGTITTSFVAGNLLIQVTAPSVAAYNWVSTFTYQKMISNT